MLTVGKQWRAATLAGTWTVRQVYPDLDPDKVRILTRECAFKAKRMRTVFISGVELNVMMEYEVEAL